MSELTSYSRPECLNTESSTADRAIANALDYFEVGLSEDNLQGFRSLNGVGAKVDVVCYALLQNPETRGEAIDLRSWHSIRLIERWYSDIQSGTERAYVIGLGDADDFWRKVHSTTESHLAKVVSSDFGFEFKPKVITNDLENNYRESLLVSQNNKAITKREWLYAASGEAHTAAFVVKAI